MKLSIIIPCYNEENTIAEIVKRAEKTKVEGFTKEIIIVEDCSTDNTRKILERIPCKIFYHQKNQGKAEQRQTDNNPQAVQDNFIAQLLLPDFW